MTLTLCAPTAPPADTEPGTHAAVWAESLRWTHASVLRLLATDPESLAAQMQAWRDIHDDFRFREHTGRPSPAPRLLRALTRLAVRPGSPLQRHLAWTALARHNPDGGSTCAS